MRSKSISSAGSTAATGRAQRCLRRRGPVVCAVVLLAGALGACSALGPSPEAPDASVAASDVSRGARARYAEGEAALAAGDVEVARTTFESMLDEYPTYTGARRQLARMAMEDEAYLEAATLLREARALCVRCAPLLVELGLVERHLGAFDAALEAYERALALEPDFAEAHFDVAVLHELYLGRPDRAVVHYERYLELVEEAPDAARIRAWIARLERSVSAAVSATAAIGGTP